MLPSPNSNLTLLGTEYDVTAFISFLQHTNFQETAQKLQDALDFFSAAIDTDAGTFDKKRYRDAIVKLMDVRDVFRQTTPLEEPSQHKQHEV